MKSGILTTELWLIVLVIMLVVVSASMLLWFDKITADVWLDIIAWVPTCLSGGYAVGRSIVKASGKSSEE